MTRSRKYTLLALGILAVLVLVATAWIYTLGPGGGSGKIVLGRGDYDLPTTAGERFSEDSLKGQATAVYFGFTHCPEVCPTTLGDIALWQRKLGDEGPLKVYFVTVDPERDSVDMLREYVSWVPGVQGVSGTPGEVQKAIRAFRVYAAKVPTRDGGYTMDHFTMVYLFDRNGNLVDMISYQEDVDTAVATIRRAMKH